MQTDSATQQSRHQCLIYDGPPSRQLPALAKVARQKLAENYRCLYLNSPPMVAGLRSYLAAVGVDVIQNVAKGKLVLSSERKHLDDRGFNILQMIHSLEDALDQALSDGYEGFWATGDMTWELGATKDFSKLLEYEWRLEELFRKREHLCGICQYHTESFPSDAIHNAFHSHPAIFINETLSRLNPHYINVTASHELSRVPQAPTDHEEIARLCSIEEPY
jgi:hypothetical protein